MERRKTAEVDMAERMSGTKKGGTTGAVKPNGLFPLGNGHYVYVIDGVLYLPMHTMSAPAVLAKYKRLIMLRWTDRDPMVFMRASDVIAAWPHVERQVRNTAAALGFAL